MTPLGPAPGFRNHPEHKIDIRRAATRRQARLGDDVLADSEAALLLDESGYSTVVYFPRDGVALEKLAETDSVTRCPFKGEARYFRYRAEPGSDDIAWTYSNTYDDVAAIAGHIAFYADRVTVTDDIED